MAYIAGVFLALVLVMCGTGPFAHAQPQDIRYLRIGTGGAKGTYYAIGSALARELTGEGRECEPGCGLEGVVAAAQLSNGSVANVEALSEGTLEAALAQADVLHWAYEGSGVFDGRPPRSGLRVVANLLQEQLHVVTLADSGIATIADLRGKRVSLDDRGSGTLLEARLILAAHGLDEQALQPRYLKPREASESLLAGRLDAFFIVAGAPTPSVLELSRRAAVRLLPVGGREARSIVNENRFVRPARIPDDAYPGVEGVDTVGVGAQLAVHETLPDALAYRLTRALWTQPVIQALRSAHPGGKGIAPGRALEGVAVPLHPGAITYYRQVGVLP